MAAVDSTSLRGDAAPTEPRRLVTLQELEPKGGDRTTTAARLLAEAASPFGEWFFGSAAACRAAMVRAVARESSEFAARRVSVLVDGRSIVGVLVALPGAEIADCRKLDTMAVVAEAGPVGSGARARLIDRIAVARELFPGVQPDEHHISRVAVARSFRRRGFGRELVVRSLEAGRQAGYERFSLDVSHDNEIALRLYESLGFRPHATSEAGGLRYLRLVL